MAGVGFRQPDPGLGEHDLYRGLLLEHLEHRASAGPHPVGLGGAKITPTWSDGSPFTGTLSFAQPYSNDQGVFAMSGNNLIINPADANRRSKEGSTGVRVVELIKSLIENCELGIRKDRRGWHVCARGPLPPCQ